MTDERARRLGLNEALFRELNEQLERLAGDALPPETPLDIVCECANADCAARLRVARGAYEQARADSALFLVADGHVVPDLEKVVEQAAGYMVVRKHEGLPAQVAEATDPRT